MKSVSNLSVQAKTKILGVATLLSFVVASVVYVMNSPHTSSSLRLWKLISDDTVTDSVHQDLNLKGNELSTVPLGVRKRKVRKHISYASMRVLICLLNIHTHLCILFYSLHRPDSHHSGN